MPLGNFDKSGSLVKLHQDNPTNQCLSEKDKMFDQRKLTWPEAFREWYVANGASDVSNKLFCGHCFPGAA